MSDRILDFADEPARLSMRLEQLVIERPDKPEVTVPFADIAVLIISHRQVSLTQSVLATLAVKGGTLVVGDERHLPVGLYLPLVGHTTQAERFAAQASASLPTQKRLWQDVVQSKIRAQGRVLAMVHGSDAGLGELARLVRSGDPDNVEGRAAQRYWPELFKSRFFRRDPEAEDQNRFLNYGYAIARAIVARAICGSGLHPSLGIHHHNRYDAHCLADDLMEPFRPLVDYAVVQLLKKVEAETPMNKEVKAHVIGYLLGRFQDAPTGESRSLFDWSTRMTASVADVFLGKREDAMVPELVPPGA